MKGAKKKTFLPRERHALRSLKPASPLKHLTAATAAESDHAAPEAAGWMMAGTRQFRLVGAGFCSLNFIAFLRISPPLPALMMGTAFFTRTSSGRIKTFREVSYFSPTTTTTTTR